MMSEGKSGLSTKKVMEGKKRLGTKSELVNHSLGHESASLAASADRQEKVWCWGCAWQTKIF